MSETDLKAVVSANTLENLPVDEVREYCDLAHQIRTAKQQLKLVNERKKELEVIIEEYMRENNIDLFETPNGKISIFASKRHSKPFNKEYLLETLQDKVDPSIAQEIVLAAFDNRPSENTQKLKIIPLKRK